MPLEALIFYLLAALTIGSALVVAFSQRYVKKTGIGTVTSLMLPYSISFIVLWTAFLLLWWTFGIELGVGGGYTYALPG